ncbi:MAG: sigma-54-dependent Fis family transcriptional regulator [Planctomycetes bacterium]|nr:sigma-54-dependent Fis family transcriptional regulator [Planctomycetota bacterium]
MSACILIAEDEPVLRESLAELLGDEGYTVLQAANGREVQQIILKEPVDLVLSDIRMPEMDGMTLLAYLRQAAPETLVMMITAYGTVQNAVTAMRAGAYDYLLKPIQFEDLLMRIQRALSSRDLVRTQRVITEQLASQSTFHNLVGYAPSMTRLFEMVRKLSAVKSNALIIGESGTGKELFARAIHYNGLTRDKPFVAVNSGAIPITLMESELFGYRRGAFTGATRDKIGFFEAACGGTLFLDEISALPLSIQSSLLRVVEQRVVVPVGDTRPRPVDMRIIAASNQDLEKQVARGEFREDLLYRLNVVKLELPPLRNRREDIPLLVHHFLKKYSETLNRQVTGLTNGAMRAMLNHEWRGNVRELENVIERAVIFAENQQITVEDLPFATTDMSDDIGEDLKEALRQFERQHIIHSLRRHHYDKVQTAKNLGIGVSSLYRKMDELAVPKNLDEEGDTDRPMTRELGAQPAPPQE